MPAAFRQLRRDPRLTLLVILTIGLGVGVNCAVFGLVNGLHRPLPVRAAGPLVSVATRHTPPPGAGVPSLEYRFSFPDFDAFRTQSRSYSSLIAFQMRRAGMRSAGGAAREFFFSAVSGDYFASLGIRPAVGRLFARGEGESPGGPLAVVLGHACWLRHFGGDPGVVGREVRINGMSATIAGVAEAGFQGTFANAEMDGYLPLAYLSRSGGERYFEDRATPSLTLIGILRPGVSVKQAQAEAEGLAARLARQYPATNEGISAWVVPETWARPVPVAGLVSLARFSAVLFLLLGAFVLLLACVNVGNLLLVRTAARRREMAVRAALGCRRSGLVAQVLGESLCLAMLGGAAGLLAGMWVAEAAGNLEIGMGLPAAMDFRFDARVYLYALGATLLAGLGAGLWPAREAGRVDLAAVLHEESRSASASRGARRFGDALVILQVGASLILVLAAGLFGRGLARAGHIDLGFVPAGVTTYTLETAHAGYTPQRSAAFFRELDARIRELPGVDSASLSYNVPLHYAVQADRLEVEGAGPGPRPLVLFNSAGPEYMRTLGIELRRGRQFRTSDREDGLPVAIVNESLAARLWPGMDPIGRRFRTEHSGGGGGGAGGWRQVVGVVRNGKYLALFEPDLPFFYVPAAQFPSSRRVLSVRSSKPAREVMEAVSAEVHRLDPDLPVTEAGPLSGALESALGFYGFRMAAYLSGVMGAAGLVLTLVGLYGVVAYNAGRQRHEIGIRLALGASRRAILQLVLGRGLRLVVWGVVLGGAGSWVLARVVRHWLDPAMDAEPMFTAAVTLAFSLLALAACYLPARRALRLEALDSLKYE